MRQKLGFSVWPQGPHNPGTTHLEVVAELQDTTRRSLEEQVLDLLAPGRGAHAREAARFAGVKNERLGGVLEALERAGELCRTPLGWQRLNRSSEGGVPVPHREEGNGSVLDH
jgi:hypothetical protein